MTRETTRCAWAGSDPLYVAYHDEEWGVPLHDDRKLFEFLVLEGAQAGLSWVTILRKREAYRSAFEGFAAEKMAEYGEHEIARLMGDAGIVRNRLKIRSAIGNARAFLDAREKHGSFDQFIWSFVDGEPLDGRRRTMEEIPSATSQSEAMSKELKRRGFKFVGATICYAFMQAVGMVNDHVTECFRHAQISALPSSRGRTRRAP
ncbi:MAG: DNA-3-methyladenine glycosylase I [Acidobacteriota bacterium]|nr:DNA-3-methyladenine glycosylase I [Acidobacteriota bacterium]